MTIHISTKKKENLSAVNHKEWEKQDC